MANATASPKARNQAARGSRPLKFINSVGCPEILQRVIAEFLTSGGYERQHSRFLPGR